MFKETSNRPDPAPIREALRGVRHVLRRVKASVRDMPAVPLPGPAGDLAGKAARELGMLTSDLDDAASSLARRVLGGAQAPAIQLPDTVDSAAFAGALYWALQRFFQRFEVPDQFVSELAARAAYRKTLDATGDADGLAAALTLRLLADGVIRGPVPAGTADMGGEQLLPVAVFSTLLWLQSERSDEENEQALLAAQDVAVALRDDVVHATNSKSREKLTRLYHEFVSHI